MNSWLEYLAFLSWQKQVVRLEDFKKIRQQSENIRSVEDLQFYVSHLETRHFLYISRDWWKQAERDKKECEQLGINTVWPFHADYPKALLHCEQAPALISWKGRACWKDHFLLSVVGSRKASADTLLWMDVHLSQFLKKKKLCLMSGGARGVDQKAHALCLSSGNPTVCFLPCGIKHYYPADLRKWTSSILDSGGALLSVFAADDIMRKSYFHIRNRVLACMSDMVFIMQAELRSGTMVTARYALHAGAVMCTLPGSPLYSIYQGNLQLINDGAFMIRDNVDLETLYHSCEIAIKQKNLTI